MSIVGVGVDIVEISRFEAISSAFREKAYWPEERAYCSHRRAETWAGLFAAKEAVAKALGTGFQGFGPREVEIFHNELGQPQVRLHGKAKEIAERKKITNTHIAISHCRTMAIAYAVAEQKEGADEGSFQQSDEKN